MKVERDGRNFDVVDDPATRSWMFWEDQFTTGRWEPNTLAAIDAHLTPDRDYLDVGAWVGPTVLWAAPKCRQVRALEPDPTAHLVLTSNVARNAPNVSPWPVALGTARGKATLYRGDEWGDSCSTLLQRNSDGVVVDTITIDDAVAGLHDIGLVKIDIEGAEGTVFPAAAERLRELGCPVILALHWPWIQDPHPLTKALENFTATVLEPHPGFPTVLLQP